MSCCGCNSVKVRDSRHTRTASDKAREKAKSAEDEATKRVAQEALAQQTRTTDDSPPTVPPPPRSEWEWRVAESPETQSFRAALRALERQPLHRRPTPKKKTVGEMKNQIVQHARTFKPKGASKKEV